MSFEWKDKKDGVDDILADDINGMAHAIIEGLTAIAKINRPAGIGRGNLSLIGRTTAEKPESATITENTLTSTESQTFYIDYKGEADFEVSTDKSAMLYVDGTTLYRFSTRGGTFAWTGEVKENIQIKANVTDVNITFTKFIGDVWVNGLMSGEQAEKLENTYTKEESHSLFAENKTASETIVETTLEELCANGKMDSHGYVVGNKWTCPGADTADINVQGKVSFTVAEVNDVEIIIDGIVFESTEFDGVVREKITLSGIHTLDSGYIEFASFSVAEYSGGVITKEQAMKLETAPTTKDIQNLISEAFGTVEAVFDEVHEYAESLGGDEA